MNDPDPRTTTVRRARLTPRGEAVGHELARMARFTRDDFLYYLGSFTGTEDEWTHLPTVALREVCLALRAADLFAAQPRSLIRIETT